MPQPGSRIECSWLERMVGSIIEALVQKMERYLKDTPPHYYPPVESLLNLVYEHYTENNSITPENTADGRVAKQNEKKLEKWLKSKCLKTWCSVK